MNTQQAHTQGTGQFQLKRPASPFGFMRQVVLFLRDASSSMRGRKASEVDAATLSLAAELALPINRGGFLIGIIDFADTAVWVHPISPAVDLNGRVEPLNVGGSTNLTAAIKLAVDELQAKTEQAGPSLKMARPAAITLSDGEHNTGPSPETAAAQLCCVADHITVGFGDSYDERLLRAIATSAQHHYRIKDSGKELRAFLAQVGQTLTKTLTQHANATTALGQIRPT